MEANLNIKNIKDKNLVKNQASISRTQRGQS